MRKRKFPYWLEGALFMFFVVPLVFFLQIACPIDTGCLTDPFTIALFSPLMIFRSVDITSQQLGIWEPLLIFVFWIIIGAFFWHLVGRIRTSHEVKRDLEEINSQFKSKKEN